MNDETTPGAHNRFFLQTFSRLELAAALLANHLPAATLANLDLDSLGLVSGSFVDDELRETSSDLLFSLNHIDSDETVLVYVLTEHKSYQDRMTPFQLLKYMVRIWEQRLRDSLPLCAIIPLVVYHGENQWTTSRTLDDIIKAPLELQRYIPHFDLDLIDLSGLSDEELSQDERLKPILLVLKYIRNDSLSDRVLELMAMVVANYGQEEGLAFLRKFIIYLATGTTQVDRADLVNAVRVTLKDKGERLMPTIAQQWADEARQEGRQEGVIAGQISLLEQLLGRPVTAMEDLTAQSLPQLGAQLQELQKEFSALLPKNE